MSKLQQLRDLQALGLPVPPFTAVSWEAFQQKQYHLSGLRFPLAVRSTYSEEDGDKQSYAGHFDTVLQVSKEELITALAKVFASYPHPEGQSVIVQEMIEPSHSGVLFAFRQGVWWTEWIEGQGEALVSGQLEPRTLLLPRFGTVDYRLRRWPYWQPPGLPAELRSAMVALSYYAGKLLQKWPHIKHGLDIEYCVYNGQLYLLQARPITTPKAAQYLLTSANHKEILPPQPSVLMTSLIISCGEQLFDYYRDLDPQLENQAFIQAAAGMPWINLSALLDLMVAWGLPTAMVARSVGADDPYAVGVRPWRVFRKLPVFFKVLWQQQTIRKQTEQWVQDARVQITEAHRHRETIWATQRAVAFQGWINDARRVYIGLVHLMQTLTGAMSGPVGLMDKLGWLSSLSAYQSTSGDYLTAYQQLLRGQVLLPEFLENYGHRGFYESDLGQRRFHEYSKEEWETLLTATLNKPKDKQAVKPPWWQRPLLAYAAKLIHQREWLRNASMQIFDQLRQELLQAPLSINPWSHTLQQVLSTLNKGVGSDGIYSIEDSQLGPITLPAPVGWDMDTFLHNGLGLRRPLTAILEESGVTSRVAIGIYPGRVVGQVWRVQEANTQLLTPPDFETIILVADALDPGWIPFFSRVQAVAAYTGGLLSHASIILREAQLPAVTQLPAASIFKTGDWVVLDGTAGTLVSYNKVH